MGIENVVEKSGRKGGMRVGEMDMEIEGRCGVRGGKAGGYRG